MAARAAAIARRRWAGQTRNQLPPRAHEQPGTVHDIGIWKILRAGILGDFINGYRYAA
ncbi:hypothetical protein ABT124_34870 [Streptomyces sp. NPDC001982]|uniref:hypothetical protein n=1 Tax=Streptomyces sp. NPDC001982 TaxID=3154405 RepID=UPI00332AE0CA